MKRVGTIGLFSGALLLAAGLILQFLIVPNLKQFPDDVDENRIYEGTLSVLLNADALANNDLENLFLRDVPVTVDRQVTVLETDGGDALVSDSQTLLGPAGPIQSTEDIFTIDRKSMEHVDNFSDDNRVIPRTGLVVGFPIGTDEENYTGWNGDTLQTTELQFVDSVTREGENTLHFQASSGPETIVDPVVLGELPPALPKQVLAGLVPALGLPAESAGQLAQVLDAMPDPVPLTYTYSFETRYWVDSDTGVLIDYEKDETRAVGLDTGAGVVPLADVWQLSFEQSAESIADATDDANDAKSALFWFGTVLPWTLILAGALVAIASLMLGRSKGSGSDQGAGRSAPRSGAPSVDLTQTRSKETTGVTSR